MNLDQLVNYAIELQSLAQAGLHYGRDAFDRERYARIREIAAEIMAQKTALPLNTVKNLFCADSGYQTPKVDTRAAIFRDGKILLVQESDGLWALPGGWCEATLSPAANTVKEAWEEAGRRVTVESLIAVQDRNAHNTPVYAVGVVKLFYLCTEQSGAFRENPETIAAAYFAEDALPPLAEAKCNADQVRMCFAAARTPSWQTLFD